MVSDVDFERAPNVTEEGNKIVPVWALATEDVSVPSVFNEGGMTPARLTELRTVLATLAAAPIATLEAHPLATKRDRSGGLALHAASPLAEQLSQLVTQTTKSAARTVDVQASGEVLYRMVVPAKVAAEFGQGLVKPMVSKAVPGGIYGALRNSTGIAAKATFVPVAGKAAVTGATSGSSAVAGAATGSAATAGAAVAGAGALTVAAPLVLMAVAVAASAHADNQRREALERITDLLEQLHEDGLDAERSALDGCRDAVDKATSILLDEGRIGPSLGLDSAVHTINGAASRARTRLAKWERALSELPDGPIELSAVTKAFPGIEGTGGTFRAHLELANLAIALKRRVLVLQAVEHAQLAGSNNPFKTFLGTLRRDERDLEELESGITSVLLRLSTAELKRGGSFLNLIYTPGDVDELLAAAYRLRALGDHLSTGSRATDVAIEIERSKDGSLVVFPPTAV